MENIMINNKIVLQPSLAMKLATYKSYLAKKENLITIEGVYGLWFCDELYVNEMAPGVYETELYALNPTGSFSPVRIRDDVDLLYKSKVQIHKAMIKVHKLELDWF